MRSVPGAQSSPCTSTVALPSLSRMTPVTPAPLPIWSDGVPSALLRQVSDRQSRNNCCDEMFTVWLAKTSSVSTWTTKSSSEVPTSCTGFGATVTMMLGGVEPPVPPVPPPPPALQAARCACLVQFGAALTFAEATPAMPTRGMLTTTVSATNRARRLLRTFIGFLLLVDGYLSAGGLRPGAVVAHPPSRPTLSGDHVQCIL